jgi:hypothetical protein
MEISLAGLALLEVLDNCESSRHLNHPIWNYAFRGIAGLGGFNFMMLLS